jgi:hypothetical protein
LVNQQTQANASRNASGLAMAEKNIAIGPGRRLFSAPIVQSTHEPVITTSFHFGRFTFYQQPGNALCACAEIFDAILHLANSV